MKDGYVSQNETMPTGEDGYAILTFAAPDDGTKRCLLISVEGPEGRELAKFRVHAVSSPASPEEPERGRMAKRAGAGK